ncbi:hypothetical protein DM15PD_01740 [Aristophania vespae]|nr:hypothetical protein DM15PD_01740 [Aristophania vespae]
MEKESIYNDRRISISKGIILLKWNNQPIVEKSYSVRTINIVYIKITERIKYILYGLLFGYLFWFIATKFNYKMNTPLGFFIIFSMCFVLTISILYCCIGVWKPMTRLIFQTSSGNVQAIRSKNLKYVSFLKKKIEEAIAKD